ncbi:CAAX protease self-immunity-domain-containing protein [Umbelopsis sp. PMI_123]|nr:CAAX protease self-immunity-domain-containing protein [Umbelopsis sp. PMI_123]
MTATLPSIGHVPILVATVACMSFTVVYLAGFYVFVDIRTGGTGRSRNEPKVIVARCKAVIISSILTAALVWLILRLYGAWPDSLSIVDQVHSLLWILGVIPPSSLLALLNVITLPIVLTASLFLGPLSLMYLDSSLIFQSNFSFERDVRQTFMSLEGLRNYVIGPLTEEFVFRACVIALLKFSGYSDMYLVFASSLYFGLAHLHHAWEKYHDYGANARALKAALLQSGFQFLYTTVFGWYVSWIFIRTDSIVAPTLCHTFCNIMGFPDVNAIKDYKPIIQRVLWCLFFSGIILFALLMKPLTDPSLYNSSVYI